jgi:hypothetical protein
MQENIVAYTVSLWLTVLLHMFSYCSLLNALYVISINQSLIKACIYQGCLCNRNVLYIVFKWRTLFKCLCLDD